MRTADWLTIIVILGILVAVLVFDAWVRSRE